LRETHGKEENEHEEISFGDWNRNT
jgi:hypothetical protein